jgi:flavin reductase (DIM6/NTAB) family NADH-FMN oxidoreductase RutF
MECARPPGAGVEPDAFRDAMSWVPTAVTVITALDHEGQPQGYTCTSLCSVSLTPPQILTCVRDDSRTLAAARARGSFAVNLLGADSHPVSDLFASLLPDKFDGVTWRPGAALGLPWLAESATVLLECSIAQDHAAGDHAVLIGLVKGVTQTAVHEEPGSLLYCRRSYSGWPARMGTGRLIPSGSPIESGAGGAVFARVNDSAR